MFKIIFYYYYLFDKNITEEDPHIWAMLQMSFFESLIVNFPVQYVLMNHYHIIPPTYVGVSIGC